MNLTEKCWAGDVSHPEPAHNLGSNKTTLDAYLTRPPIAQVDRSALVQKSSPKELALAYARAGLPVFPCRSRHAYKHGKIDPKRKAKAPLIREGFHAATIDLHQIEAWWNKFPDAAIGLALGKAGLFCFDLDRHDPSVDGVKAGMEFFDSCGGIPEGAVIARTAGNGLHVILAQPEGIELAGERGALPAGVDAKGAGGYIIAPGSKLTGTEKGEAGCYSLAEGSPDLLTAFAAGSIPKVSEKILRSYLPPKPPMATPHANRIGVKQARAEDSGDSERDYIERALACIPPDDRDTWFKIGAALHQSGNSWAREVWDAWSRTSSKYDLTDQNETWKSFDRPYSRPAATVGSIIEIARQHGFRETKRKKRAARKSSNKAAAKPPVQREEHVNDATGEVITCVPVDGTPRRLLTPKQLDGYAAFLQQPGSPSTYIWRPDFQPVTDVDLKRRMEPWVIEIENDRGEQKHVNASDYWRKSAFRRVYTKVVFTSGRTEPHELNMFRGFGVTPAPGNCQKILDHIFFVICASDAIANEAMLKLMAWQIQNIGKPSRVVVLLQSDRHQAGKGVILGEVLAKIYGDAGYSPSTMEQIIGRFNTAIRGRAFIFLDEVLFSGDRRAADAVKTLSTATSIGIEAKGIDVVQCPVGLNFWMASNHEAPAHIEEHDARYWPLRISEHKVGDTAYFQALLHEIENGGREAFAHHLLTMDVAGFVPSRDVPKNNFTKSQMIRDAVNPYDARKWLEQCCLNRQIIGKYKHDSREWVDWPQGQTIPFAELSNAYTIWQGTVKSPVSPKPTDKSKLGEALGRAGFDGVRRNSVRLRLVPSAEECLKLLWSPVERKEGEQ